MVLYLTLCGIILSLGSAVLGIAIEPIRRDVPNELLSNFTLFSQYAAGCHAGQDCGHENCLNVTNANITTVASFNSSSLEAQGVSGFVVVDHSHEIIVLQFGGTNTCPKFDIDVEFGLIDASIIANASCPGCEVHRGFWTAWNNTKNVTLPPVRDAVANYSNYQIVFVGHSLGGALATVGAADFRAQGHNVTLYSYAAPSVGNYELSKFITNQAAGATYRLTHSTDVVPRVLYDLSMKVRFLPQYSQLSPEYWITTPSFVTPNASSIEKIAGINNTAGNLQYNLSVPPEPDAHNWYIGNMSVCQTKPFNVSACCNDTDNTRLVCRALNLTSS
ncbi:alpha/beta-hydrolase [Aspergillus leporis]|uniref:feruloyl esterase n=1 Tax=Aspergillus leporis TaxID=41062 RepID=A0A5N5WJU6_9EURO|nr:alpha/beta-hydrolase [Aspergillus leporis]